ncbi:MAG: radical SAM protein, partial [Candidatus Aminicenantes bacterium]|nr:radical SAM protein [Candidatus Aminicenantes bacterium]
DSGVDSFWLDIKAYDDEVHRWLTGCSNEEVLKLPARLREMGFVLEVLSLYIPGVVESDQLRLIARLLAEVDADIPFTILAFFPQYQMRAYRPPNVEEIIRAYHEVKAEGLRKIRLGNIGVFARREEDFQLLAEKVDPEAF